MLEVYKKVVLKISKKINKIPPNVNIQTRRKKNIRDSRWNESIWMNKKKLKIYDKKLCDVDGKILFNFWVLFIFP